MSGFVIQRADGAYVRPSGCQTSYTTDITKARIFTKREQAEKERCPGNERVIPLAAFFDNLAR